MPEETSEVTLKEYFEKVFDEREKRYEDRFKSQEAAIKTAEHSRDVAIKKAEDSIEKKSDAVYVKFTGLQKTLTEVMLRSEIESRFTNVNKDISEIKKIQDQSAGKGTGLKDSIGYILFAITIIGFLLTRLG